jgi:hypothetical protein
MKGVLMQDFYQIFSDIPEKFSVVIPEDSQSP